MGKSGYHTNLSEYAGGATSMEVIRVLKNSMESGKKVFIVVDSTINELKAFKETSTPDVSENAGPYIFAFDTTEAERKIVL